MVHENFFALPACILSIINYSIPDLPLLKIFKKQLKIEDISIMRLVSNYIISFFWYFYGDKISYCQIKYASKRGMYLSLAGICIYLFFEIKIDLIDSILNASIILFVSLYFYHYYSYILGHLHIYGQICLIAHLLALLYPIYIIFHVIRNKNFCFIKLRNSIISLAASVLWFIYGIKNKDSIIKVCYGLQALLDLIQIILYKFYQRIYHQINSDMINYNINDIKEIKNGDLNENDNTAIDIEVDKQKSTTNKYDYL
jgi:hypothetical protein